ncbi:GNAT family N-acetyltransferase [Rhodococcus sp. H36-A4]|uniref:GNAT family N-acetyltransferase n=1 Tax=Rhodococcus sp. H36-A4 TaxID=3004353 RepID=UPI0022AFC8E4|nr:GNAT family N-acetyltransferase [Rhodococcus sp. H36-A4]MCZ4080193.1 GNAT family N-acetyltransferase [Rhodococcus sp. H36-A4]
MERRIAHLPAQHRFEIYLDESLAGFSDYLQSEGVRTFNHTVTLPEHRGHGLAAVLTEHVLEDSRAGGFSVIPACWFVREFIESSAGRYDDLLQSSASTDEK